MKFLSFLTSALGGSELSDSLPNTRPLSIRKIYRLLFPTVGLAIFEEEKHLMPVPEKSHG